MGLPLDTIELPDTYPPVIGYRIPRERAHLRDPGLDPDELAALALAASAVRLDGIEGSGGLWKLGGGSAGPEPPGPARPPPCRPAGGPFGGGARRPGEPVPPPRPRPAGRAPRAPP